MDNTDSLARAVEYLGATDLGNGRVAFKDGVSGRYRVVASVQLEQFARCFLPNESATVGAVLQGNSALMPSWWTPTQQFAWRNAKGEHFASYSLAIRAQGSYEDSGNRLSRIERITVNLETGEEVTA